MEGFSTKTFYDLSKDKKTLKRKLEIACESVKAKRVQDLLLSDSKVEDTHLLSDSIPLIYRVFAKQCDALNFANRFDWHVFAIEDSANGHRHFVCANVQVFWKLLKAKCPKQRHAYEVIGEGMPSKVSTV